MIKYRDLIILRFNTHTLQIICRKKGKKQPLYTRNIIFFTKKNHVTNNVIRKII